MLTMDARCAMPARQATHFVDDFCVPVGGQHPQPLQTPGLPDAGLT
jgi:hypothetical protein